MTIVLQDADYFLCYNCTQKLIYSWVSQYSTVVCLCFRIIRLYAHIFTYYNGNTVISAHELVFCIDHV